VSDTRRTFNDEYEKKDITPLIPFRSGDRINIRGQEYMVVSVKKNKMSVRLVD
jgi:hypothetical protein